MPYDDLRSFLETLDKEGQLLRVTDEVMPEPDIAAAANAAPAWATPPRPCTSTTSRASPTPGSR
ncbi:hypothetical protein ACWEQH_04365 [Streptomyces sp. NPDC004166]